MKTILFLAFAFFVLIGYSQKKYFFEQLDFSLAVGRNQWIGVDYTSDWKRRWANRDRETLYNGDSLSYYYDNLENSRDGRDERWLIFPQLDWGFKLGAIKKLFPLQTSKLIKDKLQYKLDINYKAIKQRSGLSPDLDEFLNNPDSTKTYANDYVDFRQKIHTVEIDNSIIYTIGKAEKTNFFIGLGVGISFDAYSQIKEVYKKGEIKYLGPGVWQGKTVFEKETDVSGRKFTQVLFVVPCGFNIYLSNKSRLLLEGKYASSKNKFSETKDYWFFLTYRYIF